MPPTHTISTKQRFRVFAPSGLHLRTSPHESEGPYNIITTIPYLENNLIYYGKVFGEEAISNKGDLWYYCKYITNEEQFCGFVYSVFCDMLKEIPPNTEQLDITDAPIFDQPSKETNNTDKLSTLSKPAQIVIIALVCLPCLLIVYLLFKPTKITAIESRKKKKKIKKLRKSDYYEFDDYN